MVLKDERLLLILILTVLIQIPLSIVIYTLITQYTLPYLAFCAVAVFATYVYSKRKNG